MADGEPGFAQTATRLAGIAAVVAGWTPDTFWSATPADLATVLAAFAPDPAASADRPLLDHLMEQFPDG